MSSCSPKVIVLPKFTIPSYWENPKYEKIDLGEDCEEGFCEVNFDELKKMVDNFAKCENIRKEMLILLNAAGEHENP